MIGARVLAVFTVAVTVSCASAGAGRGSAAFDSQLITEDEIVASRATTAYDAIRKLRANFFSYRGETSLRNTSSPFPTVYVDDQEFGAISTLRTIPAAHIATIRLYRAWEAGTRYGTGHMGGVIAITTRQGGSSAIGERRAP